MSTAPPASRPAAPARASHRALWLALGVVALGLGDCARIVLGSQLAPREQDWAAASTALRRGFKPGDLIVAAPHWSDAIVRLHFGDLIPVDMAARDDADRYATVWEVSTRGATAPEAAPPARCTMVWDGRVRVRRCEKPAARLREDLAEAVFRRARVAVVHAGREQTCQLAGNRIACPGTVLEPIIGEIEYEPHRCVLVPPPPVPGDILRLEWPDVPLGHTLVGYTGIHSFYARKAAKGPVDVSVTVGDGSRVAPLRFVHHNDDGWRRFEVPTGALDGTRATVRIDISSPAPLDRKLCLALEARE